MKNSNSDAREIFRKIHDEVSQLLHLVATMSEGQVNQVPYEGSWTAAQLLNHITKSTSGVAKMMSMPFKAATRDIRERIPEIDKIFLDFDSKMKSPKEIVPDPGPFIKNAVTATLQQTFNNFEEQAANTDAAELVDGLPLGPITKWELIHFVLVHTTRHVHQLEKITSSLVPHNVSNQDSV